LDRGLGGPHNQPGGDDKEKKFQALPRIKLQSSSP